MCDIICDLRDSQEGRRFSFLEVFLGFLKVFLLFSYCFLIVFLRCKTEENRRKQKENKKKTKRNPNGERRTDIAPHHANPSPLRNSVLASMRATLSFS
jgi:hypothetical protein